MRASPQGAGRKGEAEDLVRTRSHGPRSFCSLSLRSPAMLPIPGTSRVAHLEENVAAADITLTDTEFETLSAAGAAES